jgi:hypothetical protein
MFETVVAVLGILIFLGLCIGLAYWAIKKLFDMYS